MNGNTNDPSNNVFKPTKSTQIGIAENAEYLDDDTIVIISESDDDDIEFLDSYISNTNREMHFRNTHYCLVCLLCGKNDPFMANHYFENHPNDEVLISRPSPKMAMRLRLQNDKFTMFGKAEVRGICYFCDEIIVMGKSSWQKHILMHTGERRFTCEGCDTSFATEFDHNNGICSKKPVNIFLANSVDGSLSGYCCKECNYLQAKKFFFFIFSIVFLIVYHLQIELKRIVVHLMNEHGFECPTEKVHYEKVTLVPTITQKNTQSGKLL